VPQELDSDLGAGWRLRVASDKIASEKSAKKFFFMLVLSFSYFAAELVFGVLSGSLAVLADAFHMLTDVAALVTGYYVAQLSLREKTPGTSFGWKRAEVVGALCNSLVPCPSLKLVWG
jgi:cobalt-zinc-cadmium efflux system protein